MNDPEITGARLVELVDSLTSALVELVRTKRVTAAEWYATLAYLGEVAAADQLILLSDVLGLSVVVDQQAHGDRSGTASSVLGPFWRPAPELSNPAELVGDDAPGERLVVRGVVTTADGHDELTTMVFFAGDPWLGDDTIGADRPDLTVAIDRTGPVAGAVFDVVL